MSTGDYYRWNLYKERARRQSALMQRSRNGRPVYVTDADLTDWARIIRTQIRRVGQLHGHAVDGADAWRLANADEENNFNLTGGDNTDEGAAAAWVDGWRALLYRTANYQCLRDAVFNEDDAFALHHRASSVADGVLTDERAKYTVNALVGYSITINGAGTFAVTANTATTITLDGFIVSEHDELVARPWYYIALQAPVADGRQDVYLDVHLEDWGIAEDATLNHNPGGTDLECMRREVLIQRVWVRQNPDAAELPSSKTYLDGGGVRHWVLKIGSLPRLAGADAIEVDEEGQGDRDEAASAHDELLAAHDFQFVCVEDQPASLAERLMREQTVITVGPSGSAYEAEFTGPDGLIAALACDAAGPRTVFLRNGVYLMTEQVVVRDGWTLLGESQRAVIDLTSVDVDAEESMRVERFAQVVNCSIWRLDDGSATAMVRLGGRSAQLERCHLIDTLTGQAAVEVGDRDEATGGAGLVDCAVDKTSGPGVVFTRNSGNPMEVGATTSVVGTTPAFDVDAGVRADSSYGNHMTRCRVQVEASAYALSSAAVRISGGDSVRMAACEVQARGAPALYIDARISGADSPAAWTSRGTISIESSDFLVVPNAVYAAASSRGLKVASGRVRVVDCTVATLDADGQQPNALVGLEPDSMLDLDVDGLYVRAAGAIGVSIAIPEANYSRIRVDGLNLVPASDSAGFATGVRVVGGAPGSSVALVGCSVLGGPSAGKCFEIGGEAVELAGCHVDGALCTQRTLTGGAAGNLVSSAFKILSPANGGTAPVLRSCTARAHGGVGFLVYADAGGLGRATLYGCAVEGESRTLIGVATQGFGRVSVVDCQVKLTRGACVLNETAFPTSIEVNGGEFSDPGQAYLEDGVFPAESDTLEAAWAACLSGVSSALGCRTLRGFVGIVPAIDGSVQGGEICEAKWGLLVEQERVVIHGTRILGALEYGLTARELTDGPVVRGAHVSASGLQNVRLRALGRFDVEVDVHARGKSSTGVYIRDCGSASGEDDLGWRLSAEVSGNPDNSVLPISVLDSQNGALDACRVFISQARPVALSSVTQMRVIGLRADCGSPSAASIAVTGPYDLAIEGGRLRYGAVISSPDFLLEVSDVTCVSRGLAILDPTVNCRPRLRNVTVLSAVRGVEEVVAASGIYFGGTDGARIDRSVTIEGCYVRSWVQIGDDLTSNVASAAAGRSAGIRIQAGGANTRVSLRGCEVYGSGDTQFGILVGDLNQLPDAQIDGDANQHRYGVQRLEVINCIFRQPSVPAAGNAPLLVAAIRNGANTAHSICNCLFDVPTADSDGEGDPVGAVAHVYCEMNEPGDGVGGVGFVRVDFKGNVSRIRDLALEDNVPFVRQSEWVALDGGMTSEEWNLFPGDNTGRLAAVQRTNSVWTDLDAYLPEDPTA